MLAVIFELEPLPGKEKSYLGLAADLRPLLDGIDGFISVERFASLTRPGRIVSLSFWRDEQAIQEWRNIEKHRNAQRAGRHDIFAHYRLRVATVIRDYGMHDRGSVPEDCKTVHG